MNLFEYQAKELLQKYGIPTPKGHLLKGSHLAEKHFDALGGERAVLKAQIHAGGRGKAGGVRLVTKKEELLSGIQDLLGKPLVTAQTHGQGELVESLYLEEALHIEKEMYLSMSFDRSLGRVSVLFSPWGGVAIEEVAKQHPEKLCRFSIDPLLGLGDYQLRDLLLSLEADGDEDKQISHQLLPLIKKLYELYLEEDLTLLEINPLVLTKEGLLLAADAKISLDDNALFRHPNYQLLKEKEAQGSKAREADQLGFSYVELEGNIGCLVNGAGLAMATMDAVDRQGGRPANFLDIGGGAPEEAIRKALDLLLEGDQVKGVFVNVFGGINHCDVIARALVEVLERTGGKIPFVVRLQGRGREEGKRILKECNHPPCLTDSLESGAFHIVKLTGGGHGHLGE